MKLKFLIPYIPTLVILVGGSYLIKEANSLEQGVDLLGIELRQSQTQLEQGLYGFERSLDRFERTVEGSLDRFERTVERSLDGLEGELRKLEGLSENQ